MTRTEIDRRLERHRDAQQVVRALRALEKEGRVVFEGNTRARRYRLVAYPAKSKVDEAILQIPALPLSPEAQECLGVIDRPLAARQPVTYRRAFLDEYVPNQSRYLSSPLCDRLHYLGRTADAEQPAGTFARHVLERFLLDLSWSSSRLEGNTFSLLDCERLLKTGAAPEGKSVVETQMLLNHKSAIEFIVADPMVAGIDDRTFKTLHALLMENLLGTRLDEGSLRSTPVQIGASVYLPLSNPQLLHECFRQLVVTAAQIRDPFECSFFLLIHLPYLQPFLDGNKRTARLAANLPFVTRNLIPLSFMDVPRELFLKDYLCVYELNRVEPLRDVFSWAYERSASLLGQIKASMGEPDPFRLAHRSHLREVVAQVVRANKPPGEERELLLHFAEQHLAATERSRFVAMAELELESLNPATFARYHLRPPEFEAYRKVHLKT
jgi:hypothetical protein